MIAKPRGEHHVPTGNEVIHPAADFRILNKGRSGGGPRGANQKLKRREQAGNKAWNVPIDMQDSLACTVYGAAHRPHDLHPEILGSCNSPAIHRFALYLISLSAGSMRHA